MKTIVILIDGKKVERTANFSKIKQDIKLDRIVWRAFTHEQGNIPVWEVPQNVIKRITIVL